MRRRGVLVQQTVAEVLPEVTMHQSMITQLLESVSKALLSKEKETRAWKLRYNIQTQQERELQKVNEQQQAGP